jgi:hypothetical protein
MSAILGHDLKTPWGSMAVLVDATKQPVVIGAAFLPMQKFLAKAGQKLDVVDFKKDSKLAGVSQVINQWIDAANPYPVPPSRPEKESHSEAFCSGTCFLQLF